jgi:uncharacterized protein involved in exopolysaccharide biosynthesis
METTPNSPTYSEVFRAYRLRFLVPVVLAGLIALWAGFSAPKMYRAGATLWSDSPDASSAVFGAQPPATQDQQLLDELLTTRFFEESVARSSPLGAYLRTHTSDRGGPSALLARLRGPKSYDDRLAAALGAKRVTSEVKGPHVLDVNYDAQTPELAMKTLNALIKQFRIQRTALQADALAASQKQVTSAAQTLTATREKLSRYLGQHPGAGRNDPELQALAIAEREAATTLANASDTMNQATVAVANGSGDQTVLKVIDSPQLPTAPTTGKKKLVETFVGGLFAGAIVSFLGVFTLTRRQRRQQQAAAAAAAAAARSGPRRVPRSAGASPLRARRPI